MIVERVVRPAGPYSLTLCTRHATDATRAVHDGVLATTLRVAERVELGRAWQRHDGRIVLQAETDGGIEALRFLLGMDADHTEFLRRFRNDPLIGETIRRLPGMRQLRLPTVAQSLLRALCGQLIDSRRARALEYAVVRAATPLVGAGLHAPPTSADLAGLVPARLRALGLHARRGATLVRVCGELDLERLHRLGTAEVCIWVERQRGLGPWSAAVVCLEGLGRHERGLVGDLGLVKLMSDLRGRWVEAHETIELLEPYGEWAGLGGIYLMLGYRSGLVPLPPAARLKPPPARFRAA